LTRKRKSRGRDGDALRKQTQARAQQNKGCKQDAGNPGGDRRRCTCICEDDSGAHRTSETAVKTAVVDWRKLQEGERECRGEVPEGGFAARQKALSEESLLASLRESNGEEGCGEFMFRCKGLQAQRLAHCTLRFIMIRVRGLQQPPIRASAMG
jgi:hypothetical protein